MRITDTVITWLIAVVVFMSLLYLMASLGNP